MEFIPYTSTVLTPTNTLHIADTSVLNFDKVVIGSETFDAKQLAQLLKLLLKEHPELQI